MKIFFSVFGLLIQFTNIKAQGLDSAYYKKIELKKNVIFSNELTKVVQAEKPISQSLINKTVSVMAVFDPNALPFFCKIEYKMGLQNKFPVKIRLGDPDKVDEKESKGRFTPKE